jgi:hypothetical protein
MNKDKARQSYAVQRWFAKKRNIPFLITFDEWYNWWLSNGVDKRLPTTPITANTLCMCRHGDIGPYALTNIYCDTLQNNSRSLWTNNRGHHITPTTRLKSNQTRSKIIQTPAGVFNSKSAATKFYNVDSTTMGHWLKIKPTEFYYL